MKDPSAVKFLERKSCSEKVIPETLIFSKLSWKIEESIFKENSFPERLVGNDCHVRLINKESSEFILRKIMLEPQSYFIFFQSGPLKLHA